MLSAARSNSSIGQLAEPKSAAKYSNTSSAKYKAARSKRCKSLLLLSSSTTSSVKSSLLSLLQSAAGSPQHNQQHHQRSFDQTDHYADAQRRAVMSTQRANSYDPSKHHLHQQHLHQDNQVACQTGQEGQRQTYFQQRTNKCVKMKLFEQPLDKLFSPKAMKQLNQVVQQQNLDDQLYRAAHGQLHEPKLVLYNSSNTFQHNNASKQHKRSPSATYLWKFSADSNNNLGTSSSSSGCYTQLYANPSNSSSPANTHGQKQLRKQLTLAVLPEPIRNLLNELYQRGPTTVGIFRKSPNAKHCRELKHKLESDSKSSIEQFHVTVIASVFKEWLRSLPDCLLMSRLYPQWIDVAKLIEPLHQHQMQQQQQLLQSQSLDDSYTTTSSSQPDSAMSSSSFDDTITTEVACGNIGPGLRPLPGGIPKSPLTDNIPHPKAPSPLSPASSSSPTGRQPQHNLDRAQSCSTMALSQLDRFQHQQASATKSATNKVKQLLSSSLSSHNLQVDSLERENVINTSPSYFEITNSSSNNIESMSAFALAERKSECLRIVRQLLDNLKEPNLIMLKSVISVLWHIAQNSEHNKMSSSNLGVCVGQSLLNGDHQPSAGSAASFYAIGSSATFGKRHRRTRSQCILSSTLSLSSSSSPSSSAYLESNNAQETAKYVPILVAFMIEYAPELFGQDIVGMFQTTTDSDAAQQSQRQAQRPLSVTESTTSSSRASSSTSGIHSDSPALSNELESQNARTSLSNSSGVPSIVSSPSPVTSTPPSSPIQGEVPTAAVTSSIRPSSSLDRSDDQQPQQQQHQLQDKNQQHEQQQEQQQEQQPRYQQHIHVQQAHLQAAKSQHSQSNNKSHLSQHLHHHHLHDHNHNLGYNQLRQPPIFYSTTYLSTMQYQQQQYDWYLWYHRNSLKPQRSHVLSLRDYYLSLHQQQQQQQLQSTLLRNRIQTTKTSSADVVKVGAKGVRAMVGGPTPVATATTASKTSVTSSLPTELDSADDSDGCSNDGWTESTMV